MMRLLKSWVRSTWLAAVLLGTWQLLARDSTNLFFPAPGKIIHSAKISITGEWLKTSLVPSIETLMLGYLLGAAIGIALGALIGSSPSSQRIFTPIVSFLRSVPSVAIVPVIMALFGIGMSSRIYAVTLAVCLPVMLGALRSVAATDSHALDTAKVLGLSRLQSIVYVQLPAATGEILASLHSAVQVSVLVMVVSEMLGSANGLGAFIVHSQSTFMIADMWVGAFILGIVGLLANQAFLIAEKKIAPWYFESKRPS